MKNLSPMKAIRQHCISCSGGSKREVALCPMTDCPLYQFRFGKNPHRRGVGPGKIIWGKKTKHESVKTDKKEDSGSLFKARPIQLEFGWQF